MKNNLKEEEKKRFFLYRNAFAAVVHVAGSK
jgi:hypothetical protein